MKNLISGFLIASMVLSLLIMPASAGIVTPDEARSVAENWVSLKIGQQGDWGGSPTAQIGGVREFRHGDRLVGYFCPVSPQGFIVVSLRRELAPVKAYSDTSNLDPDADGGPTDLIKLQMAAILDVIEREGGPVESVSSASVTPLMEFNYLNAWDVLDSSSSPFESGIQNVAEASNYQQGGIMLTSSWHQGYPYSYQVPAPWSIARTCPALHCLVGCVATAGSQIMNYWDWPPYGVGTPYGDTYDWPRMVNRYVWDPVDAQWEDENGNPLAQVNLDAVAELCSEVGQAVGMEYCKEPPQGSCQSEAYTYDMEGVYENKYRYSTAANKQDRSDYDTNVSWFNMLKNQFNQNRPVHYRILMHSIVADGWSEQTIGGIVVRQYHMNYGWDDSYNAWYTLDGLYNPEPTGTTDDEYVVRNIYPAPALGSSLKQSSYPLESFPYRYFDQDTSGDSATFSAGQYLQFLPGVKVTCNSGTGTAIRIESSGSDVTRLFTRGDTSKGISMSGGTMRLRPGGSVQVF